MSDTPPSQAVYDTRAADPGRDGEAIMAVWRASQLGHAQEHAPKYAWFYRQCPFGAPLVRLLHHAPDDAVVGTCAAGPRRMVASGKVLDAGVLVDIAVTPRHRSLGPAMIMQASLIEASLERFDLLYGFPNAKSLPVVKRLGYSVLGEMLRQARVLRSRRYLARRLPAPLATLVAWPVDMAVSLWLSARRLRAWGVRSEWADRADERMDTLWRSSAPGDTALAVRDAAFLRWRFDACPLVSTRYLLVSDRGGMLLAWFACEVADGMLHVRDFWSAGAVHGLPRAYLDVLLAAAWRGGHAAVSVECLGSNGCQDAWRAAGFRERGRRPVIGRWQRHAVPAPGAIHLTSADEDQ